MTVPLVRYGADTFIPRHPEEGEQHLMAAVHTEMLLQVCRDYPGLPDPRTLLAREIRFFYDGLRNELKQHSKPKG